MTQKILDNVFETERRGRMLREILLSRGIADSKVIRLDRDRGEYVEVGAKPGSQPLPFDVAWGRYLQESPRHLHWARAIIEIASVLGAGGIWYYVDIAVNQKDWQYTYDWTGFRKKFTEGFRFDDNPIYLNSPGHPLAGAFYYSFARSSDFTSLESFLIGFAAASLWEVLVEYREVISYNDLVFTPVAGAAIGEVMYQLAGFFSRGRNTLTHRTLAAIFGGPNRFNQWLDRNHPHTLGELDESGFDSSVWHQFDLYGGAVSNNHGQKWINIGVETQLVSIPGSGHPGEVNRFLTDTTFTQLLLEAGLGEEGIYEFKFFAKAMFAGYYRQSLRTDERSGLRGYSFLIGPATAYEHSIHRTQQGHLDTLAIVNVLGPSMELNVVVRGVKIRAVMDVYGDFAIVRSMALEPYAELHGLDGAKSVLQEQKYYYAFGLTAHAATSVTYGPVTAGVEYRIDSFRSIEGHDRNQEEVTDDFALSDTRRELLLWLQYAIPGSALRVMASYERSVRSGSIRDVTRSELSRTWMGSLLYRF